MSVTFIGMLNPFTTEARFCVLNATAFITQKRASVVKGLSARTFTYDSGLMSQHIHISRHQYYVNNEDTQYYQGQVPDSGHHF